MGRTKGTKNIRKQEGYWLPEGIVLAPNQSNQYTKETKLLFLDKDFGEFTSYFKALQLANASTHPKAVSKRRQLTNTQRYGGPNPSCSKEIRAKAEQTMLDKYGSKHALQNETFLNKSKETLKRNYNIDHPMYSEVIKQRFKNTLIEKYGVDNPMKSNEIKERLKNSNIEKYGVENPMHSEEIREKHLKNMLDSDGIARSKGELEVKEFIEYLGIETNTGFLGGANPKQIDILIKDLNIGIEYNGAYWHSEANKNMYPNYHYDKYELAKSKNIKLLQIFDFEWDKRNFQVKSYLKSALGKNQRRVYARETIIKDVDKKQASQFLEDYHILGTTNFKKAYGLYSEDELLCLITIGHHHRNSEEIVLSRFVGKYDVTVVGGLSKLTEHAFKIHGPISTWIDLRFSNGQSWINNGWGLVNQLRPDYFYYNIRTLEIVSKQSRKKSTVNTPSSMTEHEHALSDNLRRIYDCGKLKLLYNPSN